MSRVNVVGVLMPDGFYLDDDEAFATLERFKRELSASGDDLELYVDSPGGDVLTSNAMSNLLAEWCIDHPQAHPTCRLGGLCASAAANLVTKLPKSFTVEVFEDTLAMWHSASAMVEGGPERLRDNAMLMDLINSVVMDKLLAKTTIDPDRVRNAFREGREMWLDGRELVACGLADRIVGSEADKTIKDSVFEDADTNKTEAYRYAACVSGATRKGLRATLEKRTMEDEKKEVAEMTAEATASEKPTAQVTAEAEVTAETEVEKDEIEKAVEKEEDEKPEVDWEAQCTELKQECDELKKEVESLKALVAKYQPTAKPEQTAAPKAGWLEMVRELNAKHLSEHDYANAYVALKQSHPEEFKAFMSAHSVR